MLTSPWLGSFSCVKRLASDNSPIVSLLHGLWENPHVCVTFSAQQCIKSAGWSRGHHIAHLCSVALEQPWPCWECPRIVDCLRRRSTREQLHGSASAVEPRSSPLPGQADMPIFHNYSDILKKLISYDGILEFIFKMDRKMAAWI